MQHKHQNDCPNLFKPELKGITKQLFDQLSPFAITFGGIATIGSAIRIGAYGFKIDIILDIATYFLMVLLLLLRNRIPIMTVAAFLLLLLGCNACTTFFFTGLVTSTLTMFCACCVVAGVIFGFTAGCVSLSICSITLIVAAALFSYGKICALYPLEQYIQSPQAWISIISGFFVFSLASLVVINFIQKRLFTTIHELNHQSQALHTSERKFRLLAENMHDVLLQLDKNLTITYVSPSVSPIFGYTPGECLSVRIDRLSPPQKSSLLLTVFDEVIKKYDAGIVTMQSFECELCKKNGAVFPAEFTPSLIRDDDGVLVGIQGIIRDISKQKQAEQEKEQLEKQLRHAEKLEVIGQLAGGIAHDFNNQLAGILGFAELIKSDHPRSSETYNSAHAIASIAKRSADLTSKLLAFARKGNYVSQVFDIHLIIREVIDILSRSIDRNIGITEHFDAQPRHIKGDPGQIQNALLNIALNARDAMQQGGTLDFTTRPTLIDNKFKTPYQHAITPGQYIHIIISDTGTGIDDDTKQHLFEPFFTTKAPGKGTGMGLAAVYGTIQAHDGLINVTSVLAQGTAFHIYLPLTTGQPDKSESEPVAEPPHGSGHILLVEDEANVGKMIGLILKRLGYSFELCINGTDADTLYRQRAKEFDAVIVDLMLPGISGGELIERMRSVKPESRILICSGYSADNKSVTMLQNSRTFYLRKPFSMNELSQMVRQLLSGAAPRTS